VGVSLACCVMSITWLCIDSQKIAVSTFALRPRSVRSSVGALFRCTMAVDIFAKIGDIKGESLDDKHKDEVEVLSYSWGVTNAGTTSGGGGGGAGRATFQDLSIVHKIDKASPQLLRACATGQHLKEATITFRKAGKAQQEFLVIKMNDVIITGVAHSDAHDSEGGSETVNLEFAKVDWEFRPQKPNGTLDAGIHFKFDIKANKDG
jgi:type VI secretion system secreted protein Hcp